MLALAIEIVEGSETVRSALRQTYTHVFLDEFQDCTGPQYRLIRAVFFDSDTLLTAVGDTKQSIMSYAGALEGIFTVFASDFSARSLNIYFNRRSLPRLRRMQNAMVQVMDPAASAPLEFLQGSGGTVDIAHLDDEQEEARYVSSQIWEALQAGKLPSEIAVLVTRQPHLYAASLMQELRRLGIPFRDDSAVQDLTAERIGAFVLDLLRLVFGVQQSDPYARLTRLLAQRSAEEEAKSRAHVRWTQYLQDARSRVADRTLDPTSEQQIRDLVYGFLRLVSREALAAFSRDYQRGRRMEDLIERTLTVFSDELLINQDPREALRHMMEDSTVRILTIHKSKGLEFELAVILAVEKEQFWGSIGSKRASFFVGISRAKSRIILTAVNHRRRPEGYTKRWDADRTPHREFFGYATDTED